MPNPPLGAALPAVVALADGVAKPRGFGVPDVNEKDGNDEAVVEVAAAAPPAAGAPNENPVLLAAAGAAAPNANS